MNSSLTELKYIFEKNLKWKINQKAKTTSDEFKLLINNFKFYDSKETGEINKDQWIKAILKIGLIGFSDEKLINLFDLYIYNQSKNDNKKYDNLKYKQFTYNLLYNSLDKPIICKKNNYLNINKSRNLNRNNNFSYSCDYKNKIKNEEENKKNKNNIYNYKINVKISNEQYINKSKDEDKNDDNNNNNEIRNNIFTNNYNHNRNTKNKNINNNDILNLKYFIKNIMDIFRAKINIDNGVTFYKLLQNLKLYTSYEDDKDLLSISKLNLILKESNLNFTPKELQNLFCIIDFNDTGYISINKFLKVIKGNLNDYRKKLLINIFNRQIDIHKNGIISIYYFKRLYNAKKHPDIINNKMNETEAMTQFIYTFDIFCKVYKIIRDINCSQFIQYYEGISPSIPDDFYFKEMIYRVWTRSNDFDETYFPKINYQNINFNLEKKMNKSISSPLMSINNNKINTLGNNNNNFNNNNQLNALNNNYFKYNNNTLNNIHKNSNDNKICLRKVNLTPINHYPINNSLTLNDIQNNNMYNYKSTQNNNNSHTLTDINLNKSANINSYPYTDIMNNNNNYYSYNYNKTNGNINEQEKDKYNYSQIILNNLRNILIKRGIKSIFYLQRMLTNCDPGQTGVVSLSHLNNIFRVYNFNIYYYDIKLLFQLFDIKKIDAIPYDNLIKAIVGKMNEKRKNLIIKLYESFNKDLYGYLNIKEIKNRYNCYKHPSVIIGNKTHEEVYGDFLECIEIYREYIRNINKGYNDLFSLNEFLEFFEEISMYFIDDNDFENLIYSCWDLK